ncbi:The BTB (BR-C, ttk and bab)/POZ (Pox virus and Zinc finger) domain [Ceratobasidium sp. AG-Ba]|nr:The BTB (BR-C, ttk and bab)/POZ (Pox virus and Zinc finger) domain [Ceratobasidium sp. AG-Ba]
MVAEVPTPPSSIHRVEPVMQASEPPKSLVQSHESKHYSSPEPRQPVSDSHLFISAPPSPDRLSSSKLKLQMDTGLVSRDIEQTSSENLARTDSQTEDSFVKVPILPEDGSAPISNGGSVEVEVATTHLNMHPQHNYADGSLVFQVEHMLCRIHRHVVDTSPVLMSLVDRVSDSANKTLPKADFAVVQLAGVNMIEFSALLELLYTPFYASGRIQTETYQLALPLCMRWGFEELRDTILSRLEDTLSLLDRCILARQLNTADWERSCLIEFVARPDGLTLEEGRSLGVESVIFISGLREEARTRGQCSHTCISCDGKSRMSAGRIDITFIQEQVKSWLERT